MSNVIRFRANRVPAAAFGREATRPPVRAAARPVLIAVWHRDPASGRLLCRWRCETEVHADEAGSRRVRAA